MSLLTYFQFKNLLKKKKPQSKGKVEGKKEWYNELGEKERAAIKQKIYSLKIGKIYARLFIKQ